MSTPTFREKFKAACLARFKALGRRMTPDEVWDEAAAIHEYSVLELQKEWEKRRKERKKAGIDERAGAILNVYPRRVGGDAALIAITKAIATDGFEQVLECTTEYARAVARWAPNRRKAQSGASLIPMPTTFFGNRRYLDDQKDWWEGTGGRQKAATIEILPEPEGWRFAHPESRYVKENEPWERIDLISQRWIINNTPVQKHA